MQSDVNAGVYKAGFANTQEDYDKNVVTVFAALNKLERLVVQNGGPFVLGKEITELDIRLYATLIRFDTVYVQHFKCNLGTIRHDYPVLNNWLKGMYWNVDAAKASTDFKHIKENVSLANFVQFCFLTLIFLSIPKVIMISTPRLLRQWALSPMLKRVSRMIGLS
jgi:putative glutathione S-transferase